MAKLITLFFITCISSACYAQKAEVIKFDKLEKIIHQKTDKLTVINFWATWCGPCIKELPYFESLNKKRNNEVDVFLISVDFASKIDLVDKFIRKKKLESTIYLLDEIDYNSWIDKVDSTWSGAIPATLIINQQTGKRKFIEGELYKGDLERYLKEIIN